MRYALVVLICLLPLPARAEIRLQIRGAAPTSGPSTSPVERLNDAIAMRECVLVENRKLGYRDDAPVGQAVFNCLKDPHAMGGDTLMPLDLILDAVPELVPDQSFWASSMMAITFYAGRLTGSGCATSLSECESKQAAAWAFKGRVIEAHWGVISKNYGFASSLIPNVHDIGLRNRLLAQMPR